MSGSRASAAPANVRSRRGMVLVMVLVIIALLAASAGGFVEFLVEQRVVVASLTQRAQALEAMRSAVERARVAGTRIEASTPTTDKWAPYSLVDSDVPGQRCLSFCVATDCDEESRSRPRPGLSDESGRLNLNALPLGRDEATRARATLMRLPGMTESIADAILDWLDEDDEPRTAGAELSYYSSLSPSYRPSNGPLRHIDELRLVRGVTEQHLYGAVSRGATASRMASRFDTTTGPIPWSALLTLDSAESNRRPEGRPKIDVNRDDLPQLYDDLERSLGETAARYIVAWRLAGPAEEGQPTPRSRDLNEAATQRPEAAQERALHRKQAALARVARQKTPAEATKATTPAAAEGPAARGGLNLKYRPAYRVRSLIDLIGGRVVVPVNNVDAPLESPWPAEASRAQATLEDLSDRVALESALVTAGRINPLAAPRPVLLGVPGMKDDVARRITIARLRPPRDPQRGRRNLGWMIEEGVLDWPDLRALAPHFTVRGGDVHRTVCAGCFEDGRHLVGSEVIVRRDGPRAVLLRERRLEEDELIPLMTAVLPQGR